MTEPERKWRFATEQEAQKRVYSLENPDNEEDEDWFVRLLTGTLEEDEEPQSKPEPEPLPNEVVINSQKQVGSIIEWRGARWLVLESHYTSDADAADLEDGWDVFVEPGWSATLYRMDELTMAALGEFCKRESRNIASLSSLSKACSFL